MQEIKKWQDVADSLDAIIIAPVGTETKTTGTHKLGWNAIDCCGDPVLNEIDDMDRSLLVLIGPEGDFSLSEIERALEKGFKEVTLGNQRFRTETAGIVACSKVATLREINTMK